MPIGAFASQEADSDLLLLLLSDHKGNKSVISKHIARAFYLLEIPAMSPACWVCAMGQLSTEFGSKHQIPVSEARTECMSLHFNPLNCFSIYIIILK